MKSFTRPLAACTIVALSLGSVVVTASAASAAEPASDITTIDALFDAGEDVTLTADITDSQSNLYLPENSSSTLDLNGHSLTLTGASGKPGILVQAGSHLTITDTEGGGVLTATGGSQSAGIGSELGANVSSANPGLVEITGGTVNANGASQVGAGIGGSGWSAGPAVTISGGVVNARSFDGAAAIGAGYNRTASAISITGGEVHASGGNGSAAIGGSMYGGNSSTVISGGDVELESVDSSVLGAGGLLSYPQYSSGSVAITGGSVSIAEGSFLTIPDSVTVTSSGEIANYGDIRGAGTLANSGAVVGNGEVTAKVTGNDFVVSYDALGGEVNAASVPVRAGSFSAAGRSLPVAGHESLPFTGWNTKANGTGTTVVPTTDISSIFPAATGAPSDVTLYAMYGAAPDIENESLAGAVRGEDYSQALTSAAASPIDFSVIDGGLPAGLELSEDGIISGTPTKAGLFVFTVLAHNEGGADVRDFAIDVQREATEVLVVTPITPTAIGSKVGLRFAGLDAGEGYTITSGGQVLGSGVADSHGWGTPTITVPSGPVGERTISVTGSNAQRTGDSPLTVVAAKATFSISTNKKTYHYGQKVTITVKKLAPGEKVTITFRGKTITPSYAHATSKGTYTIKYSVGSTKGTKTIKVTGASKTRAGSNSVKVKK